MCISLFPIKITGEVLYVGEVQNSVYGYIHVFGLRATVQTIHGKPNALIFPVPAQSVMTEENIIQTGELRILDNVMDAFSRTSPFPSSRREEAGIVIARSAGNIAEALEVFPSAITQRADLYTMLGEFYPDYQMVVCYVDGNEELDLSFWCWYAPQRPEMLFIPTFVSLGDVFNISADVPCDRWILLGSNVSSEVASFASKQVMEKYITGWYRNADTIAPVDAVHAKLTDAIRRRPFTGLW